MRYVLTCLLVLAAAPAFAAGDDMNPWAFVRPVETIPAREHVHDDDPAASSNPVKLGFGFMFNVWRDVLSKIDGPKCPHYPTCSQFSRESIGRYGPAWGLVMTGNRLAREYPSLLEDGHYKVIYLGQPRAFDPPEQAWLWGEYLNPPHILDPE